MTDNPDKWTWDINPGFPDDDDIKQFYHQSPPKYSSYGGGLFVKFSCGPLPEDSWTGNFESSGSYDFSGVFSLQSQRLIFAVSGGYGYVVQPEDPDQYEKMTLVPVVGQWADPSNQVLVFSSFTDLVAYDANGRLWLAKHVSHDGIKIHRVTDKVIEGTAWDPASVGDFDFVLDIETGNRIS